MGDPSELWDDKEDPDDEDFEIAWLQYIAELEQDENKEVPSEILREIDAFKKLPKAVQENALNGLLSTENAPMQEEEKTIVVS